MLSVPDLVASDDPGTFCCRTASDWFISLKEKLTMSLIKRYPNRKLYNTETKQYITLEVIADLIRQGDEIQVIDHTSGEDLTAVTLTQIIFEQEKKQSGFLPKSVLTGLIQAGGDTLNSLRRTLATPLNLLHQVEEEIDRRLQALIKGGELTMEEALRLRDKLIVTDQLSGEEPVITEAIVADYLARREIPTRDDLAQLHQQVDELLLLLDDLDSKTETNRPAD
jgi:polyhydroxyalkanoate synthesis repressor PhaR